MMVHKTTEVNGVTFEPLDNTAFPWFKSGQWMGVYLQGRRIGLLSRRGILYASGLHKDKVSDLREFKTLKAVANYIHKKLMIDIL